MRAPYTPIVGPTDTCFQKTSTENLTNIIKLFIVAFSEGRSVLRMKRESLVKTSAIITVVAGVGAYASHEMGSDFVAGICTLVAFLGAVGFFMAAWAKAHKDAASGN